MSGRLNESAAGSTSSRLRQPNARLEQTGLRPPAQPRTRLGGNIKRIGEGGRGEEDRRRSSFDTDDMGQNTAHTKISCSNCGESLDPSWAHLSPRPPCPACGQRGVAIAVGIAEEINIAASLNVGMHPHDTDRNWRRRWTELESE